MKTHFYKNSIEIKQKGAKIKCDKYSVINTNKNSKILLSGNLSLNSALPKGSRLETILTLCNNAVLSVNGNFTAYYNTEIYLFKNARLDLGWSYINAGTQIRCMESIRIGNQCAIGRNVMIMDFDAHSITYSNGNKNSISKPIVINDHVWIGAGSTILKGVTIGTGAIIGAGSVVTKDIPPNTIAVGVPAKVIKSGVVWE